MRAARGGWTTSRRGRAADAAVALLALVAAALVVAGLRREARARGYTAIDTRRVRLAVAGRWIDPRWQELLAGRLARLGPVDAEDEGSLRGLVDAVRGLAFVRSVGSPSVIWPNGVRVPVELRPVVACARIGRHFQPIAEDGTVLPGRWPAPPRAGTGFLPVVGPLDAVPRDAQPSDRIDSPAFLAGLSVASSMWACLDASALERLGRVVIDASGSSQAGPEHAGVRLSLEEGREIVFGRAPCEAEPGELPVARKWRSVAEALELLASGERDWGVVDVRWDRPELGPRGAVR